MPEIDMAGAIRAILKGEAEPVVRDGRLVGLVMPEETGQPTEQEIIGYTGDAEQLCIECVRETFAQGDETAEQALDRVAAERGINRADERSYDSRELPKPLTLALSDKPEHCGRCLKLFGRDPKEFRRCPDDDCGDWVTGAEGEGRCVNCGKSYDDSDFEEDQT